uniref:Transthyretin/hydroxyisourate hydrolase domain-containing protein n=1 Tax=Sus scrofa TaxID=9823 RepID=A0A8D1VWG3_PIG
MISGAALRLRTLQDHLGSLGGRGMEPVSSPLTTHVLDTASGLPAQGLCLRLSRLEDRGQQWTELTRSSTDPDGRCPGLLPPGRVRAGTYKLSFDTEGYWKTRGQESFYPYVEVREVGSPCDPQAGPAPPPCLAPPEERAARPLPPHAQSLGTGVSLCLTGEGPAPAPGLRLHRGQAAAAAAASRPLALLVPPLLSGCFHYHERDPQVPRASAAEPVVLHHIPRELAGGCQRAYAREPGPRTLLCGLWPHGAAGHTSGGRSGPRFQ